MECDARDEQAGDGGYFLGWRRHGDVRNSDAKDAAESSSRRCSAGGGRGGGGQAGRMMVNVEPWPSRLSARRRP